MPANDIVVCVDLVCNLLESLDRLDCLMHRGIVYGSLDVNVTGHGDEIKDV
jgi:hypothetical protein